MPGNFIRKAILLKKRLQHVFSYELGEMFNFFMTEAVII